MNKLRIAIIGFGNIGKYAIEAVNAAKDMELAGVVRRCVNKEDCKELYGVTVTDDIKNLGKVDVCLLCVPSRSVPEIAKKYLSMGINTVDSYDIHSSIFDLKSELGVVAKHNNAVSVVAAGWDPGSDSIVRTLMEACAPKGITYTDFGPGMSMGHSVAAKAIEGVVEALSMTIPLDTGIHRRIVYVQISEDADFEKITQLIKNDPYFIHDETQVIKVDCVQNLADKGHGVRMIRKGVSGETHNQRFEFVMTINNPALTTQVMLAAARASVKQTFGAYTLIEIPVIDLLEGDKETIIRNLV